MKNKDLIALLNRAAAVIEDPQSESLQDQFDLVQQLTEAAKELGEQ